ncbi:Mut7-C RNAse domain-containing protein [Streptomyces sp. ACA25]|uniref:Mut7-C RNAse domain-containing protein n=1 Tax=Streptomyces sp. ACA25 TaxID=3022596 RepID=UPI00230802B4|nr:Mut7-C RNAse domain-containing protein [Streptomyces sp. ACA25]MDB1088528.1 Mut7-C RNAse domain-containing protein [Streptomyces sp. ACA25]
MIELSLRFPPELRFFLSARHRTEVVRTAYDGTSSLGHVVESLGVPLTEVGCLRADGRAVAASHRPADGARVDVRPVPRPQALPGPPAFLLDVHLGTLARRLRLVGVDTAYHNDAEDEVLLEQANAERRTLLTQDRGLLRRRALWSGAYVRGSRPDEQLVDVLRRFAPPLAPWTRCLACNGRPVPVPKAAVDALLRPGTRRNYESFLRCPDCGRVYWRGAHHGSLEATVARARGLYREQRPDHAPGREA